MEVPSEQNAGFPTGQTERKYKPGGSRNDGRAEETLGLSQNWTRA